MRKEIEFLHFGERCGPYIIINLMLKNNKKTLFQLGVYPFNTIVNILEDEKFDDIINLEYIRYNGNKVDFLEIDKKKAYSHCSAFTNIKYEGLQLQHDYELEENTIINYNFINESHNIKKTNFYNSIKNNNFLCFICLLFSTNILDLEFEKMVYILKHKYSIESFIITIFTNDKDGISKLPSNLPKEYEIIFVENDYRIDIYESDEYRINLYKDMWEKFRDVLKKYNYHYSSFEEQFDINLMPRLN